VYWISGSRQSRYSEEIGDWTKRFLLVCTTGTHELAGSSEMAANVSEVVLEMTLVTLTSRWR
jgi:hypothetical protein